MKKIILFAIFVVCAFLPVRAQNQPGQPLAIGYKVYSGVSDGGQLDVSFLTPGIYFLERGRKYNKFIKV